jgi:hypothetical protein
MAIGSNSITGPYSPLTSIILVGFYPQPLPAPIEQPKPNKPAVVEVQRAVTSPKVFSPPPNTAPSKRKAALVSPKRERIAKPKEKMVTVEKPTLNPIPLREFTLSDEMNNIVSCLEPKLNLSLRFYGETLGVDSFDFVRECVEIFYRFDALNNKSSHDEIEFAKRQQFLFSACRGDLPYYNFSPLNLSNLGSEFYAHERFMKLDEMTRHRINKFLQTGSTNLNSFKFRAELAEFLEKNGQAGERVLGNLMFLSNEYRLTVNNFLSRALPLEGKPLSELDLRLVRLRRALQELKGKKSIEIEQHGLRNGHIDLVVSLKDGENLFLLAKNREEINSNTLSKLQRFAKNHGARLVFCNA